VREFKQTTSPEEMPMIRMVVGELGPTKETVVLT
jgi:hypothetical protein